MSSGHSRGESAGRGEGSDTRDYPHDRASSASRSGPRAGPRPAARRTGQVKDGCIHADCQVELFEGGSGVGEVRPDVYRGLPSRLTTCRVWQLIGLRARPEGCSRRYRVIRRAARDRATHRTDVDRLSAWSCRPRPVPTAQPGIDDRRRFQVVDRAAGGRYGTWRGKFSRSFPVPEAGS